MMTENGKCIQKHLEEISEQLLKLYQHKRKIIQSE
jgi:hypothetical protein